MLLLVVILGVLGASHSASHHDRIAGGVDTTIEKHPYQVSIQREFLDGIRHNCGGAIYTNRHIVTAAHCIFGNFSKPLTVRVGSTIREEGGQVFEAVKILPHPKFGWQGLSSDVGVMVLNDTIKYGPTAQPIKLVPENHAPQHGEMMTVTGWGLLNYEQGPDGNPNFARILQELRVPVINRDFCVKSYKKMLDDTMICAGGGGNNAGILQADSGGPLVNSKGELVGIVSFSHAGYRRGYPGVFTDVANPEIRKYIHDNLV